MNSQIFKVLTDIRRTLNHLLTFAEMQTIERQLVCDRIDQIDVVLLTPQETKHEVGDLFGRLNDAHKETV